VAHLGLKSKSHGKGNCRFLVVQKSNKSRGFDEAVYNRCHRFIRKTYFARSDVAAHKTPHPAPRATSRISKSTTSGGYKSVSVRPGDRIGQGAPELVEAKGSAKARAMMEKMGWSAGQGLGKAENKGILNPVEQVVWHSRAGLG